MTLCEYSSKLDGFDPTKLKSELNAFAGNVPEEYALAAREGVNNKKERLARAKHLLQIIKNQLE